jgi:hypothetical protein
VLDRRGLAAISLRGDVGVAGRADWFRLRHQSEKSRQSFE